MARYAKFFSLGGGGGTNNLQLPVGTILDTTLRQVQDGLGTGSPLYLSTGGLRVGTTAGSAMYWDDTNNRLGIGTTTPLGILHLKSTAAITRMVIDGDAGFNKLISYRTAGLQRFGLYVNNTAESGSNAGSDFAIRAYSDAGTLLTTPIFIKRSTGNVGIGTTTPTSNLVVASSGSTTSRIQSSGDSSSNFIIGNDNSPNRLTLTGGESNNGSISSITNGSSYIRFRGSYCLITNTAGDPNNSPSTLAVKGSGSTSTTTSLLVQNSSSTAALTVKDDLTSTFGSTIFQSMGTSSLNLLTAGTTPQTSDRGVFVGNGSFNNASIVGVAIGNNTTLGTGTGNIAIGFTANASGGSIAISQGGLGATASGGGTAINGTSTGGIAIGGTTNTSGAIGIGSSATATATNSVAVGFITAASGSFSLAIGDRCTASHTQSIAIGLGSKTSANGDFVAGGYFPNGGYGIYNVYFGTGPQGDQTNAIDGDSYAINGSGGFGTNRNGGNLTLAGGKGTGSGTAGNVIFSTSTVGSSGTTLQTLTERMRITGTGNVGVGEASPTARLQVKGSGSTSATTALLVQNSGGTTTLSVNDAGDAVIKNQLDVLGGGASFRVTSTATSVTLGLGPTGWMTYTALETYFLGNDFYANGSGKNLRWGGGAIFGSINNRNASAIVQITSTTQGFLPPRMTTAQKNLIATPATGLMVFDTDLVRPCFFNGATWITL
jgi:hypothetical protein